MSKVFLSGPRGYLVCPGLSLVLFPAVSVSLAVLKARGNERGIIQTALERLVLLLTLNSDDHHPSLTIWAGIIEELTLSQFPAFLLGNEILSWMQMLRWNRINGKSERGIPQSYEPRTNRLSLSHAMLVLPLSRSN